MKKILVILALYIMANSFTAEHQPGATSHAALATPKTFVIVDPENTSNQFHVDLTKPVQKHERSWLTFGNIPDTAVIQAMLQNGATIKVFRQPSGNSYFFYFPADPQALCHGTRTGSFLYTQLNNLVTQQPKER